jgi:glutamate-1-semialdehyde 2,1-aminomutase
MGSSRLPGKVMKKIEGASVIELLLKRLSKSKLIDVIVVAVPENNENEVLYDHVKALGFHCHQGSENDVLSRFYDASKTHNASVIVRITGDCPLIDPLIVDEVIDQYSSSNADYFSNVSPPTFPDGLDVEVFSAKALEIAHVKAKTVSDREHVTPYLLNSEKFIRGCHTFEENLSNLRWTLDEQEDFELITKVFGHFSPNKYFSWLEVLDYQRLDPSAFEVNQNFSRNEGLNMSSGQKLYKRAKNVIPGGNMLLSKRPEMFLPDHWPSYYSKAKGCSIWDLDGREYIDMSLMGVGTNILGYANEEVDQAVVDAVLSGNMSTLNCPEEVALAEKLVSMHPWADMVKFARSGGEANAMAIRIARAASGRNQVAVCGYHGWHDWYLAVNLNDEGTNGLTEHLLPGLEPKGVPSSLRGSVFPFSYNDYDELERLVKSNNIGVIKMEVVRSAGPEDNFLEKVRKLADDNSIVLVFDECTSGFRETFGGIHKKYRVDPDMVMFGKALGNGFGITAVVGRREIMEAAQSTFISSTFWTERAGPSAALKTLEVMERERSWETITAIGSEIRVGIEKLAAKHELSTTSWGLSALTGYTFIGERSLAYKTLVAQEMLKKGYLAGNSTYACLSHTPAIVSGYLEALDPVFALVRECEEGRSIDALLEGPVCHDGFKRLN